VEADLQTIATGLARARMRVEAGPATQSLEMFSPHWITSVLGASLAYALFPVAPTSDSFFVSSQVRTC